MTEKEACIALNMLPGMGPVRLRSLLGVFGSPAAVLAASAAVLRGVQGIGMEVAEGIANWRTRIDLDAELEKIEAFGAKVITAADAEYPTDLLSIHNPPIVLYVWGELKASDARAIGIVGSRNITHYGTECAKRFAFQLASAGYCVVSGLARGIDTAAHQGALAAKGRTVAVVGSGLAKLYPPENKHLASLIAASGAVVSEYPMERPADRQTFPYRNRIVAGWSQGLLVVEAGMNSGALITANQALNEGRQIFAVPGPIDRPTSSGSNQLIKDGARLVTCVEDIIEGLGGGVAHKQRELLPVAKNIKTAEMKLGHEETLIVTALEAGELTLDEISAATRLPAYKVSSVITLLEMRRIVRALPGQRFAKRTAE